MMISIHVYEKSVSCHLRYPVQKYNETVRNEHDFIFYV